MMYVIDGYTEDYLLGKLVADKKFTREERIAWEKFKRCWRAV